MNNAIKKLNALGTIYFVLAVLFIPASFIFAMEVFRWNPAADPMIRAIIMLVAAIILISGLLLAACIAIAGHAIRKHRWRPFCFTVSVLLCLGFPLGTALGVFSLMTLIKPEVKEVFSPNQ